MLKSLYIEDIFIEFFKVITAANIAVPQNEYMACHKFYDICTSDEQLTEKQANYIITLLKKYKSKVVDSNFDYSDALSDPKYKKQFRIIDETRKVWIDKDDTGTYVINLQFPYSLKNLFDEEIEKNLYLGSSKWDHTNRIRIVELTNINFLKIFDFVNSNGFIIDESVYDFLAYLENLYDNERIHLPRSYYLDDELIVNFLNEESKIYFEQKKKEDIQKNVFLAKLMGYPLVTDKKDLSTIEKISTHKETTFWLKNHNDFFDMYKSLDHKICIILDRNIIIRDWIEVFVKQAEENNVDRSDIKVCWRADKSDETGFNQWIKDSNLGGSVATGKIFIFNHKPGKWIFKDDEEYKIVVLTNITPPTNLIVNDWVESHPCVIYLTDIKPTTRGKKKVVEL